MHPLCLDACIPPAGLPTLVHPTCVPSRLATVATIRFRPDYGGRGRSGFAPDSLDQRILSSGMNNNLIRDAVKDAAAYALPSWYAGVLIAGSCAAEYNLM